MGFTRSQYSPVNADGTQTEYRCRAQKHIEGNPYVTEYPAQLPGACKKGYDGQLNIYMGTRRRPTYLPMRCTATAGGITKMPTRRSATARLITKQFVTVRRRRVVNTANITRVFPITVTTINVENTAIKQMPCQDRMRS